MAGFYGFWQVLTGSGKLWRVLTSFDGFWQVLAGFDGFRRVCEFWQAFAGLKRVFVIFGDLQACMGPYVCVFVRVNLCLCLYCVSVYECMFFNQI